MKFLQGPIEKKLSALLDRKVTFARLSISPLAGKLEAENLVIDGETIESPLLRVAKIEAKINVAKALMGQIVVRSLWINRPEIFLVRRKDGSLNLPPKPAKPPKDSDDPDGGSWRFEAQSVEIRDGTLQLARGEKVAIVRDINLELKPDERGKIDLAAIELRGTSDLQNWLDFLPNAATATVRVEVSVPWEALFPTGEG